MAREPDGSDRIMRGAYQNAMAGQMEYQSRLQDRERLAFHEAGHVTLAALHSDPDIRHLVVRGVRIIADPERDGYASFESGTLAMESLGIILAGGPVAEWEYNRKLGCRSIRTIMAKSALELRGSSSDWNTFADVVRYIGGEHDLPGRHEWVTNHVGPQLMSAAESQVRQVWPAIEAVAKALVAHDRLDGRQVCGIVEQVMPRLQLRPPGIVAAARAGRPYGTATKPGGVPAAITNKAHGFPSASESIARTEAVIAELDETNRRWRIKNGRA